jgi:hypothetical protein
MIGYVLYMIGYMISGWGWVAPTPALVVGDQRRAREGGYDCSKNRGPMSDGAPTEAAAVRELTTFAS